MMTVTVCVGSSCHIKGARKIIVRFNELLKEHGLEDRIELQGSFCMERCGEGLNWQIDEQPITSNSVEEAIQTFTEKVLQPSAKPTGSEGTTKTGGGSAEASE
jgi:NADH:ubiquinone oxidoreductase subunit E